MEARMFDVSLDPELDEWARAAFGELRRAPLVQPSRDIVQAVLQRLSDIEPFQQPRRSCNMESRMYSQVHEGMDVRDRDGDDIGKAGETMGQYFNVDAGLLGMKEYYVPFEAVTEVRDDTVYLNVDKDDIGRMGWDKRPSEAAYERGESDRDTLRLREEELQARKTSVETGRVHLGKEIVEEQRTMEVPVTREEVTIERRPVDRRPADEAIDATRSETIQVPVREEQVEVEKQSVVYEEVGVGKRATQETQEVSETVRREELRVDREGDVEVRKDPKS
jgi:uncharacterized protein (TIGR02271 family)